MNKRNRYDKLNQNFQQIRRSNRFSSQLNSIRFTNPDHIIHNLAVVFRCLDYLKSGIPFITEGIFLNGSRCDIYLPIQGYAEEVLISETQKRFEKKASIYPVPVRSVRVTKEKLKEQFNQLIG